MQKLFRTDTLNSPTTTSHTSFVPSFNDAQRTALTSEQLRSCALLGPGKANDQRAGKRASKSMVMSDVDQRTDQVMEMEAPLSILPFMSPQKTTLGLGGAKVIRD